MSYLIKSKNTNFFFKIYYEMKLSAKIAPHSAQDLS